MANLPLYTNVLFMTVMANRMPFIGRSGLDITTSNGLCLDA